ncbi:MAG: type IV pilin N-terminal domain-containing protein [Methanocorpusculum sp.]|nr:type IV pilin N-terminal domain-containing protein [Methanocorpusculum sp.]
MSSTLSEFRQNSDSAISPVIAVLLILALTVVTAAIVGAFAMGIINPGSLNGKIVGVTAESYLNGNDHGVRMTLWGGEDFDQLESVRAEIGGYNLLTSEGGNSVTNLVVGGKYEFSLRAAYETDDSEGTEVIYTRVINADAMNGVPVNFIGKFKDGTEQVIYMWRLSVPGISGSNGIFYNDGDISVSGYFQNKTSPARGFAVIRNSDSVKSVKITAINLQDTEGHKYSGTDKLSNSVKNGLKFSNSDELKFPFIAGTGSTNSPYVKGTISDSLTGTVNVKVIYNDETSRDISDISVELKPRVGTFVNPDYAGSIFNYRESIISNDDDDEFYVKFNTNDILGPKATFFIGLETGSDNSKLHSYPGEIDAAYYSESGHRVYGTFDLESKNPSTVVAFYVYRTLDESPVWYIVDKKTVGELISKP